MTLTGPNNTDCFWIALARQGWSSHRSPLPLGAGFDSCRKSFHLHDWCLRTEFGEIFENFHHASLEMASTSSAGWTSIWAACSSLDLPVNHFGAIPLGLACLIYAGSCYLRVWSEWDYIFVRTSFFAAVRCAPCLWRLFDCNRTLGLSSICYNAENINSWRPADSWENYFSLASHLGC